MTTTQLEAGRELDALVAEKVMGWTFAGTWWSDGRKNRQLARFSTDIAAAWQVVEKILDQLSGFECCAHYLPFRWRAEFAVGRYVGEADSPALAICRAALAAVGEPQP